MADRPQLRPRGPRPPLVTLARRADVGGRRAVVAPVGVLGGVCDIRGGVCSIRGGVRSRGVCGRGVCGGVRGRGSVCGGVRGGARGGVGARGGHGEVCVQGTAEARLYQRLKLTSRAALMASCEETQREYNKLQLRNSRAS